MKQLLNYNDKKKNIYKVDYQIHERIGTIIIIQDLHLYYDSSEFFRSDKYFNYLNKNAVMYHRIRYQYNPKDKDIKIKFIEITPQLQQLLYSEDNLNRSLGTQIIFNKLGINYECL